MFRRPGMLSTQITTVNTMAARSTSMAAWTMEAGIRRFGFRIPATGGTYRSPAAAWRFACKEPSPQRSLPPCGGGTGRGVTGNSEFANTPLPGPPPRGGREHEAVPALRRKPYTASRRHARPLPPLHGSDRSLRLLDSLLPEVRDGAVVIGHVDLVEHALRLHAAEQRQPLDQRVLVL